LREQIQMAQEAGREADVQRLLAQYQQHLATDSSAHTATPSPVPSGTEVGPSLAGAGLSQSQGG
jgi:hypothetical protein